MEILLLPTYYFCKRVLLNLLKHAQYAFVVKDALPIFFIKLELNYLANVSGQMNYN